MSTVIAIPSYRRQDAIVQKTLNLLLNTLEVPTSSVFVFVANPEEFTLYAQALPSGVNVVEGKPGIGHQRKFINSYFEKGTRIVSMDDDLIALLVKQENKTVPFRGDFMGLVNALFDLCDSRGLRYWGVPETNNGMFMNHQAVVGLRQCAGAFCGEYAQLPAVQSELEHCEDVEKFVRHYQQFGGILRVNDLAPKQKFQAAGGVVDRLNGKDERVRVYHEIVANLLVKYPGLILPTKKESDYGRIKIKNITTERLESPVGNFMEGTVNRPLQML